MEKYVVRKLKVTNLLLSSNNPRFDSVNNQREALEMMVTELGEKLLSLANDIVGFGINPSELAIVVKEGKQNNYKVLEGNRRLAALKLLSTPEMFRAPHKNFTNKLIKISKSWNKNKIKDMQCVVFSNEDDANRWIELKHTGENKGRGVVPWDAQQSARFNSMIEKKESVGLQVIDFLKNCCGDEIDKISKKISITNLERLLTDKNVQSVLGIQIKDGILETSLLRDEIKKGLLKIAKDIASKKVKVVHIYTKDDRKKYIETFKPGLDIPDSKKQAENVWQLTSLDQPGKGKRKKTKTNISFPLDRHALIPRNCILSIKEAKLNNIYTELKNINIDEYTNAVAVLFRVFLELSVNSFVDKYNLPKRNTRTSKALSLRVKLNNVEQYMESQGMASKDESKGLRVIAKGKDSLYSVDTFNDYVHNRHFSPAAKDLKTNWDNIQVFITKLWSNI